MVEMVNDPVSNSAHYVDRVDLADAVVKVKRAEEAAEKVMVVD
jgi:hypothetical protein